MHILTRSIVAVVLAASAAHAQAKQPSLSGEWTLNPGKSDFGAMPAPTSGLSATTVQSPASFKLTTVVTGGPTVTQEFPLSAKDTTWTAPDGQPATSSSSWAGDTLVINTKLQRQGMDISLVGRWSTSADGKTMTMMQQSTTPMGPMNVTLVFDRKN